MPMDGVSPLSTVVALVILVLITSIGITAIVRYPAEDAIKVLGAVTGIFGVVIGSFITYFFTKEQITTAHQRVASAETTAQIAQTQLAQLEASKKELIATINMYPPNSTVEKFRGSNEYRQSLASAQRIEPISPSSKRFPLTEVGEMHYEKLGHKYEPSTGMTP